MRIRKKRYDDSSPLEFLLLRDSLGIGRYRKKINGMLRKERYF